MSTVLDHLRPSTLVEIANDISDELTTSDDADEFLMLRETFDIIQVALLEHGSPFAEQVRPPFHSTLQ